VWTTKKRAPLLCAEDLEAIGAACQQTAPKMGAVILAFGGTKDHVHVLLRYRPDLAVSSLVRALKASTSDLLKQTLPQFAWQEGYGAFSVSPGSTDPVKRYIQNQAEHHAQKDLWYEVEPS
jgi:REP element-mobilizing transposase RayT